MLEIAIAAFLFTFTLILAIFKWVKRKEEELKARLKKVTTSGVLQKRQEEDELNKPFAERIVAPILHWMARQLTRFTPTKSREKLTQSLEEAGNPGNLKAHEYQALQFLFVVLAVIVVWFWGSLLRIPLGSNLFLTIITGFIAYLLGKTDLKRRAKKRKADLQKSLPDALDLLTVSVEAGLGFDAALMQVVEKSKGVLAYEFMVTLRELQMGKTRREALRDLGIRTGVEDLRTFVGAVIQADQLGVPITNILRTQAEQVRLKRRQRVEEQAMKAPIKMLFPLVFFIFPSIFIVLLGSAAIQIYQAFASQTF